MAIDPQNHPEFPDSTQTLIFKSLFALVKGIPEVVAYCKGGIEEVSAQDVRSAGPNSYPAIWMYLFDDSAETQPSNQGLLVTTISILLYNKRGTFTGTRENLERRVLSKIEVAMYTKLILRDEDDNQLTDSVINSGVVEAPVEEGSDSFIWEMQPVFGSIIDQTTQLPSDYPVIP